jgi:3D (Asp-Asp-Asp) domain-containing protein
MKNLARGGVVLILLSLFVVLMYAQTSSEISPVIANDSQKVVSAVINNEVSLNNNIVTAPTPEGRKGKLVEKTVLTSKSDTTTTAASATGTGRSMGSFTATAYCLQGRTANGGGVRRGVIAADPRVLRLGSRISLGAGVYSGSYLVADTGGAVKGRKLDIWVPSCAEARRFGRRTVQVFVQ